MTTKPIFLCGFMAVGKSSVGKLLASHLQKDFVDSDEWIEQTVKKPIFQIFKESGETGFRELEAKALKEFSGRENCVVALGGGALGSSQNSELIRISGILVYLSADVESLLLRLSTSSQRRPMLENLDNKSRRLRVIELLKLREADYAVADIKVDTELKSPQTLVFEICEFLEQY